MKTVSELFSPISGEVVEVNAELGKKPEVVNSDPYGQGWMLVIKLAKPAEVDQLMTAEAYRRFVEGAAH